MPRLVQVHIIVAGILKSVTFMAEDSVMTAPTVPGKSARTSGTMNEQLGVDQTDVQDSDPSTMNEQLGFIIESVHSLGEQIRALPDTLSDRIAGMRLLAPSDRPQEHNAGTVSIPHWR